MIKVSVFSGFNHYDGDAGLANVLGEIRSGRYRASVEALRVAIRMGDASTAERLKKRLPAFTTSATYNGRRVLTALTTYTPLVVLDLDNVPSPLLPLLKERVAAAPYTVCAFLSPGGQGLKVIAYSAVRHDLCPRLHRRTYDVMKDWYANLLPEAPIDASGSDIGRLCFFSYDPELFLSPRFLPWLLGEAGLPEGLELLPPEEGAGEGVGATLTPPPVDPLRTLSLAIKRTVRKQQYTEGNRNNFLYLLAINACRLGLEEALLFEHCREAYPDFPADELAQVVRSAYTPRDDKADPSAASRMHRSERVEEVRRFLSNKYIFRRNEVRNVVEYRRKQKKSDDFIPITDYTENSFWCSLQLGGIDCKLSELHAVIHSDFSPAYDPITGYFEALPPWTEGTDPIGELAATITTTAPAFWDLCFRRWLVACVACAIRGGRENHSVLLLSGAQGLGKTTWMRHLVPPELEEYVYCGNLDPSSKEASLLMCDCFLIILDELSGQSRMELNRLKAMITKNSVRERRAYARNVETYTRRASFCATVNDSQVLTDSTGSRRFLCFEALTIDYLTPVSHAAVYAQALALLRSGFRYWFADADIIALSSNNEPFQISTPEEELFFTYFHLPQRMEPFLLLSCSEIVAKISEKTRLQITNMNVVNLGRILKQAGFSHKRGMKKRVYEVVENTSDEVKAYQMGLRKDGATITE